MIHGGDAPGGSSSIDQLYMAQQNGALVVGGGAAGTWTTRRRRLATCQGPRVDGQNINGWKKMYLACYLKDSKVRVADISDPNFVWKGLNSRLLQPREARGTSLATR
jgi:hypothetical protein